MNELKNKINKIVLKSTEKSWFSQGNCNFHLNRHIPARRQPTEGSLGELAKVRGVGGPQLKQLCD